MEEPGGDEIKFLLIGIAFGIAVTALMHVVVR